MKSKILLLTAASFSFILSFTSCKKDNSDTNNTDSTTEMTAQTDDETQVSSELNAVADDADAVVSGDATMSGRVLSICDATATAEITGDIKKITITYDGTNCRGNRKRTGTVVISMPKNVYWKNAGAVITIEAKNLKITRVRDNKSITINGTKTITNVTGGLLVNLSSQNTITHKIQSEGITVTFDNNTQRTWKLAEQRDFTYNNGIVITETGFHTEGNTTGIAVWGLNRFGNEFSSAITSPLVVRQDCDFRLVSGTIVHTRGDVSATLVFGLDVAGLPVSCPVLGTYYFKATWTGPNGSLSLILPY
jgi:hypothetical protein